MSQFSNPTTQFVLDQFDAAYDQSSVVMQELVSAIWAEWPTERPTERYTYLESTPQMRIWMRGDNRESKAFRAVSWTTDTYDYQVKVEFHRNDDQDHQGRMGVKQKATSAGNTTGAMPIRFLSQMVESATDHELLPSIPTAPDGAAPFATTAGGSARFGATGGNLLTGSGAAGESIRDDYFAGVEQFMLFQNTEGFPLWDPGLLSQGITIMYPVALMQAMAEAFKWNRPVSTVMGADGSVGAAATTNITQDFQIPVTPIVNPYLSDTVDWYMFLNGSPVKPIYQGVQQPLQNDIWDRSNSDIARDSKVEAVGWDARWSHGFGPMYQSIKINNA